jgi:oxygen-independent coproporphyrinogen-3 oxidase
VPGVYLSYPFCAQKCTYCNFASGVLPRDLEPRYSAALIAEIRSAQWNWTPETVYWGGGTPSQMDVEAFASVMAAIPGDPWREATLEAAPGTITPEKSKAWISAGINRVSLGVQSFIDTELRRTGRKHTASIVEKDVQTLRAAGIEHINIDLIAGLSGQTRESWQTSLDWVERLAPDHVSVYMLEVDEDSRLGREIILGGQRFGALDIPTDEQIVDCYETAAERLKQIGIPRYEISNFARPGSESLHNLKYWKLESYLGFGADAHSFDHGWRRQNSETAQDYIAAIEAGRSPVTERTPAEPQERLYVGLRLSEGILLPESEWGPHTAAITRFRDAGLLDFASNRLRLTARGILISNEIFAEFI